MPNQLSTPVYHVNAGINRFEDAHRPSKYLFSLLTKFPQTVIDHGVQADVDPHIASQWILLTNFIQFFDIYLEKWIGSLREDMGQHASRRASFELGDRQIVQGEAHRLEGRRVHLNPMRRLRGESIGNFRLRISHAYAPLPDGPGMLIIAHTWALCAQWRALTAHRLALAAQDRALCARRWAESVRATHILSVEAQFFR